MPTKVQQLATSAVVFIHTCEICQKHAYIGYGCNIKKAIDAYRNGDKGWYRFLGHWFCMKCDKKENGL